MAENKMDRMRELVSLLNNASEAYYAKDEEIMSNFEYDKLYDELTALETELGVTFADSPTVQVGYEAVDELPKERHELAMLSLAKTKSREELADWLNGKTGLLSWKLDGLTIVLTYREGALQKAVTRGNGEVGEVVTGNASRQSTKIRETFAAAASGSLITGSRHSAACGFTHFPLCGRMRISTILARRSLISCRSRALTWWSTVW